MSTTTSTSSESITSTDDTQAADDTVFEVDPRFKDLDSLPSIAGPRPTPAQLIKVYKAYGEVEALGPIGYRLGNAVRHSMRAFYDAALDDKEYVLPGAFRRGALDVKARIVWDREQSLLVLAFKGLTHEWDLIQDSIACVRPSWIDRSMAGTACVHHYFATAFMSLLKPDDPEQPGLLDTINHILNDERPLRVLCCGYSLGGALATLAAVWVALQMPMADVRCITFQAPKVGNSKFLKLFRWLVAANYRIVHSAGLLFSPHSQPYDADPNADGNLPVETAASAGVPRSGVTRSGSGSGSGHRQRRVYSVINEAAGMVSDLPYYAQLLLNMLDPERALFPSDEELDAATTAAIPKSVLEAAASADYSAVHGGQTGGGQTGGGQTGGGQTAGDPGQSGTEPSTMDSPFVHATGGVHVGTTETPAAASTAATSDTQQHDTQQHDSGHSSPTHHGRDTTTTTTTTAAAAAAGDGGHRHASNRVLDAAGHVRDKTVGHAEHLASKAGHAGAAVGHTAKQHVKDVHQHVEHGVQRVLAHVRNQPPPPPDQPIQYAPQAGAMHTDTLWGNHKHVYFHARREDATPTDSFEQSYTVTKVAVSGLGDRATSTSKTERSKSFGSEKGSGSMSGSGGSGIGKRLSSIIKAPFGAVAGGMSRSKSVGGRSGKSKGGQGSAVAAAMAVKDFPEQPDVVCGEEEEKQAVAAAVSRKDVVGGEGEVGGEEGGGDEDGGEEGGGEEGPACTTGVCVDGAGLEAKTRAAVRGGVHQASKKTCDIRLCTRQADPDKSLAADIVHAVDASKREDTTAAAPLVAETPLTPGATTTTAAGGATGAASVVPPVRAMHGADVEHTAVQASQKALSGSINTPPAADTTVEKTTTITPAITTKGTPTNAQVIHEEEEPTTPSSQQPTTPKNNNLSSGASFLTRLRSVGRKNSQEEAVSGDATPASGDKSGSQSREGSNRDGGGSGGRTLRQQLSSFGRHATCPVQLALSAVIPGIPHPCCPAEARVQAACAAALEAGQLSTAPSETSDDFPQSPSSQDLSDLTNSSYWPANAFRRSNSEVSEPPEPDDPDLGDGMDGDTSPVTTSGELYTSSQFTTSSGSNNGRRLDHLQSTASSSLSSGSEPAKRYRTLVELESKGGLSQADKLSELLMVSKVRQALLASRAAYHEEDLFRERTGISKCRLVSEEKFDTQVYVGWLDNGTAVFAFRGTANAKDARQDLKALRGQLDFLPGKFKGSRVHVGFMQQLNAVISETDPKHNIAQVLDELSGGRKPLRVLCTGHSLGGALATLGAVWAGLRYHQADIRCITFGSPRVGNRKFRAAYHAIVGTSIRIINGADPIPDLPPPWKFTHVHNALHFTSGDVSLTNRHTALPQLALGDHFLYAYARQLYEVVPAHMLTEQEIAEFGSVLRQMHHVDTDEQLAELTDAPAATRGEARDGAFGAAVRNILPFWSAKRG